MWFGEMTGHRFALFLNFQKRSALACRGGRGPGPAFAFVQGESRAEYDGGIWQSGFSHEISALRRALRQPKTLTGTSAAMR